MIDELMFLPFMRARLYNVNCVRREWGEFNVNRAVSSGINLLMTTAARSFGFCNTTRCTTITLAE
eukprot:scaffold1143_cov198-Alexandrium_tamarense.AAC.8